MNDETKSCPFCGEQILAVAIKCKHCGSALGESAGAEPVPQKSAADYGMFLLAIPVIATLLIWFYVSGMALIQSPGDTLTLIMIGTIVGTAIFAAMEASKLGSKSDRERGTYSPTAWFFIISLLWLIGYPAYMYKRRHFGLPGRLGSSIVVMLIFLFSYAAMSSAIEEKKAEARGSFEQMQQELEKLGR